MSTSAELSKLRHRATILQYVKNSPGITATQLAKLMKLSESYIQKVLDMLHDEGSLMWQLNDTDGQKTPYKKGWYESLSE